MLEISWLLEAGWSYVVVGVHVKSVTKFNLCLFAACRRMDAVGASDVAGGVEMKRDAGWK